MLSEAHPKKTLKCKTKTKRPNSNGSKRLSTAGSTTCSGSRTCAPVRAHDAEDIVQDVFLRLFRSEEDLSRIGDVERYLWRSIANRCRDFHRRRRRTDVSAEQAGDIAEPDDREMHDEYLRIERLLAGLPDEQAETVRLRCTDSLTFAEIAELTEVSEATAKSRWRYAIEHLRKEFFN